MGKPDIKRQGKLYENLLMKTLKYGKDNAIVSRKLCDAVGLKYGQSGELLRLGVILFLVRDDHVPIGSCEHGFYLISNQEELDENLASLRSRMEGMKARMDGLIKGFTKYGKRRPRF